MSSHWLVVEAHFADAELPQRIGSALSARLHKEIDKAESLIGGTGLAYLVDEKQSQIKCASFHHKTLRFQYQTALSRKKAKEQINQLADAGAHIILSYIYANKIRSSSVYALLNGARVKKAEAVRAIKSVDKSYQLVEAFLYDDFKDVIEELEHGADPNVFHEHIPLIHYAATSPELLEPLLKYGVDINAFAETGGGYPCNAHQTLLHELVELGGWTSIAMIKRLLEKGADVNAANRFGQTPLHCAVDRAETTLASLLLESGADVNARGYEGKTPFLCACSNRSKPTRLMTLLGEAGADMESEDDFGGNAMWHAATPVAEIFLRERGLQWKRAAKAYTGDDVEDIITAILHNDKGKVTEILDTGIDLSQRGRRGTLTIKEWAESYGRRDIKAIINNSGAATP